MSDIWLVIAKIILVISSAGLFASLFALVRVRWVFNMRINMIDEDYEAYKRLPTFDAMMRRFWVWDIEAFKAPVDRAS